MAKDGITVELVTAPFNRMLEELAAIDPNVEFSAVVRSEAASVMAGALSRTKAASVTGIKARAGGQRFTTFNGKTYFLGNRYPDALWAEAQKRRAESLATKLGARGISKQSWAFAAAALGRPIKAPAYVMNANYKGRQWPSDGTAIAGINGGAFSITIENNSPVVQKANGGFALAVSIQSRTRYFERNMEHRFYDTLEHRAKKYPGIFTSPVPPAASSTNDIPSAT